MIYPASSNDLDKTLPTVSNNHDIFQDDCFPHGYRQYRAVPTGSLSNQGLTTALPPQLTATPLPVATPPSVASSLSPPQSLGIPPCFILGDNINCCMLWFASCRTRSSATTTSITRHSPFPGMPLPPFHVKYLSLSY